ncbi:protein of unknown function [Sanguibacter gelidistatuariae]|uniref:DUF202 domain-containing protein n=1 Tax=Sanguibacter gelidistatuariae TaxID=1814289 RepID=A0A1G6MJW9_9MICO|nr:DUF202 domain-containing protein [Sanguibacter gelidistatuariae]SDC55584.1 protein of unknown function [Sanguibacter gelidistatuariae]
MSSPDEGPERAAPSGAQPERTALAWHRTVMGTVVGSLLLAMTAIRTHAPVLAIAAAGVAVYVALRLMVASPARSLRVGTHTQVWPGLVRIAWSVACLGALGAMTALIRVWAPWS